MAEKKKNLNPENLVFGLDIGTRNVVGTVGYTSENKFHVVSQVAKEHDTRAMLDGQIHDIDKVGRTIFEVKQEIEAELGKQLHEVCIAAAGRVLKTVTTTAEVEFGEDTLIDAEHIYTLEMLGVENAYERFHEENDSDLKFYCVGYTVVKYYMNDYPIANLEKHKAKKISLELIATFLPDDVVDGLYRAVEVADLQVSNLTLEPIAAMQAAVPQMYRMLNLALVDVGAGTSDISVTKDGSIVAYGMIPKAGDELTEAIATALLLDFNTAETVKSKVILGETIEYADIMGIVHKIEPEEVLKIIDILIDDMAKEVGEKIIELNGGKAVSAVFVVGGGGKIPTFTEKLANILGIINERVALRGPEVLKEIDYKIPNPNMDSLFVTPVGICLNFYEQRNNFIFVNFNGERIKLYDNGHLTVVDAAMQSGFPNESLFPKRGNELTFTVNEKQHMVRGQVGEPAVITLNNQEVSLNTPIQAGDKIKVKESTKGKDAYVEIKSLPEFKSTIDVVVNNKKIVLPKFAEVNGELQSEFYEIKDGDDIKMLNFYTVRQIAEFMDVIINTDINIYVNNKVADLDSLVYENFNVIWTMEKLNLSEVVEEPDNKENVEFSKYLVSGEEEREARDIEELRKFQKERREKLLEEAKEKALLEKESEDSDSSDDEAGSADDNTIKDVTVTVNGREVTFSGKTRYLFAEVFDKIGFNLKVPMGKAVVSKHNGYDAIFAAELKSGDEIEVYWEK